MIVQYILSLGRSPEHTKNQLEQNAPQFLPLLDVTTCSGLGNSQYGFLYLLIGSFEIILYTVIAGIVITKTVRLIRTLELTSLNTHYAAEKRLFMALCFQCAIPLLIFVIPLTLTFILSFLRVKNITVFAEFTMICFSFHGTLNGLLVIMTIQPYRKALRKIFSKTKETKTIPHSLKWISSR
uniref:G protein-coupled receptor n=1 Tax=Panagrolaimus sp. JU765 TaxID=591449 RepID=A0AC34PXD6_9BILA